MGKSRTHGIEYSRACELEDWLTLLKKNLDNSATACVEEIVDELCNDDITLISNFLNPIYKGLQLREKNDKLQKVILFLVPILKQDGMSSFFAYLDCGGIFKTLFANDITSYLVFWCACEIAHPKLSQFALKVLNVPAFTYQIDITEFSKKSFTGPEEARARELYYSLIINK